MRSEIRKTPIPRADQSGFARSSLTRGAQSRAMVPPLATATALLLLLASPACPDVKLDGTVGPAGPLSGPDFRVTADLGRQVGPNLFHSFSEFSLTAHQSATFTGP